MKNHKRRHLNTCCACHPDTWSGQNKILSPLLLLTQHYNDWIITVHTMQKGKDISASYHFDFWWAKGHLIAVPVLCAIFLSQPCCNPTFFFCCSTAPCSCRAECHPTQRCHAACIVSASAFLSQLAETSPFPQRDGTQESVNQDVTIDTLQTCEQTSFSRAVQRGVGNSCHSFLLLYRRWWTCGA